MSKTISKTIFFFKYCKSLVIILLIVLLSACAQEPPKELPLSEWTTEQLVVKGRTEFEAANYSKAARYLKEAADRDDPDALYALGYMHYYGNGVPKDPDMAQDLIRRSAAFGHKPAIKALRLFIANKSTFTVDTQSAAYLADNKSTESQPNSDKLAIATVNSQNHITTRLQSAQPTSESEKGLIKHSIPSLPNFIALPKQATVTATNDTDKPLSSNPNKFLATLEKSTPIPDSKVKVTKVAKLNTTTVNHETTLLNIEPINSSVIDSDNNSLDKKDVIQQQTQIALELNRSNASELNDLWLRKQNPNSYTVQVTAKKSLPELQEFINANNLSSKAQVFSYLYKNEIWYGAGVGVYQKPSLAYQAMLNDLPKELKTKAKASKPWVRQFKNIQDVNNG